MLVAVANKMQSALLAPTEVLAEQHFLTLKTFLRDSNVAIELFTSRTKRQGRAKIQKSLADGKVHLAVGTQALIQEDVDFANLGLVVVDEQHKLGVRQRATLKSKGCRRTIS
jgi:ATP-dependent DNA helicase RecG